VLRRPLETTGAKRTCAGCRGGQRTWCRSGETISRGKPRGPSGHTTHELWLGEIDELMDKIFTVGSIGQKAYANQLHMPEAKEFLTKENDVAARKNGGTPDLRVSDVTGGYMKRAFLYGLGSFLIVGVIASLMQLPRGHGVAAVIVAFLLMPLSVLVIRAAGRAPPNRSRLYAVVGWLLGFFVVDVALLAVVGISMLFWMNAS